MKRYRGYFLMEAMVVIAICSLFLALPKRTLSGHAKGAREENALVFMGAIIGEMRLSAETMSVRKFQAYGSTLELYKPGNILRKRVYLSQNSRMATLKLNNPTFGIGANYSFEIFNMTTSTGVLQFYRDNVKECEVMVNFGTQAFDIR
jgi:Tfp pilus assembly protein FimT